MGQITVFSGAERRRQWNDEQKLGFVAAAFAPGAVVAEVARAADLSPSQIYRWRRQFGGTHPVKAAGSLRQAQAA